MTVLALAAKELQLYFTSFLFYALASVFLALSAFYFSTNLSYFVVMGGMQLQRGLWQYQFLDMQQRLLVLLPLLTMRLFAEERQLGTLDLLLPFSLFDRFYTFALGAVDTGNVSYLVLFTVAFLCFTLFALDARRWRGVR